MREYKNWEVGISYIVTILLMLITMSFVLGWVIVSTNTNKEDITIFAVLLIVWLGILPLLLLFPLHVICNDQINREWEWVKHLKIN